MALELSYKKIENQKSYWLIEVVSFTIRHLNLYLKKVGQKCTLNIVILKPFLCLIERFNRTFFYIRNKPRFENGDGS